MNVFSTPPAKSLLYPCSRRSAIAFPAFATSLAPTFFPAPPSLDSRNPGQNPGSPDRRAKGLEAILKFYASDAAFLQPTGEGINRLRRPAHPLPNHKGHVRQQPHPAQLEP